MDPEVSDEELMLRYCNGDAGAFDLLYARHKGKLFRFVVRQCRDTVLAEELFQEIWFNLIRARSRYQVEAKFSTYLYCLAHNRLIDYFRSQPHVHLVSTDDEDAPEIDPPARQNTQPEQQIELKQQVAKFFELLESLPVVQKEAFLLYQEAGLSIEQIAEVTGTNKEAAKSRLRYAVAKIKTGLQEFCGAEIAAKD